MATEAKQNSRHMILKAAAKVFAERGIKGATTREIAKEAGIHETTLFRHFESKETLLKAVVLKAAAETMTEYMTTTMQGTEIASGNLEQDLLAFAKLYNNFLEENEPIVRTFIGEAQRDPDNARLVLEGVCFPFRERLIQYMTEAQVTGKIGPESNIFQLVDAFSGTIFAGLIRRGLIQFEYSTEEYLESCVSFFLNGISPTTQAHL